jgi:hypothetical protein
VLVIAVIVVLEPVVETVLVVVVIVVVLEFCESVLDVVLSAAVVLVVVAESEPARLTPVALVEWTVLPLLVCVELEDIETDVRVGDSVTVVEETLERIVDEDVLEVSCPI